MAAASRAVAARAAGLISDGGVVLLFWPMAGEPDLRGLVAHGGPTFALTRTPATGPLTIHPWSSDMERHAWGFEQPRSGSAEMAPDEVTEVLVPGVGFGRDGSRLGHGKGYYDELLQRLPSARRIGVTWQCRLVDSLPSEPHDVAMDVIVTEEETVVVSG